ncbi:UvrD-helicase domain-containing protein [Krasilnikoviella flava]|uniref:RecBCD enzyme subunit RecB n=1 Tax=Krasilnikoviella flava TaxID=526729 RepID=A0A1T5LIP6_9MICO|nr:UvrD-helicase domain-containing protein [Krasilnikoviella flava]SKC75856.1 exodeoxyribonuclease V beta subunit [Krasilnikoviella flava]
MTAGGTTGLGTDPTGGLAGAPERPVFDVCGPLPEGTTVLEASAGTGKTFTIAALATRFVAEGRAELRELMLVTFGRAATSELRDRVRERLVSAERALRGPDPASSDDPVIALLADVDAAELDRRRARLAAALSQLDAATITTTHGFCQQMLTSLGIAADVDPAASFVADVADLAREVSDDLYVRRFADEARPALTPSMAADLGRAAVSDHQALVEPAEQGGGAPTTPGALRQAVALETRTETLRRKRAQHLMDYDDLLVMLREALADPVHGPTAAQRVRSRFRVVMVDEFQDTDPVQWEILRTAFHGHRTLVLIGDPKQAIYAFRGADVVAYLDAQRDATAVATLGTSWRSDEPLLRALDTVLGGAALGDERIVVRPVDAAHGASRFDGGAPLRLRQVTRAALGLSPGETPPVGPPRQLVAADVAADIAARLGRDRLVDAALVEPVGTGVPTGSTAGAWRPLEPRDVAVLTRTNAQAEAVRSELTKRGVPAVVSGLSSVFATPSARDWLTLLAALEQPGAHGRAAALALTPFVGWDAEHLATADDAAHDALADTVRRWSRLLWSRGVAALQEAVTRDGLAERLMRTTAGERRLTDLRHVGEVLHVAAVTEGLGASALTAWLRRRIREAAQDYDEERSRRLETDAAAVQVVTVHASKGLEFGVVYVPFAWDRFEPRQPDVLRFHAGDGRRILHVGGPGSFGYDAALERHRREEGGEDLRLLYVALTRARHQVVAHWAPSKANTAKSGLTRVALGERTLGGEPSPHASQQAMRDDAVRGTLGALAQRSGGTIAVEEVPGTPSTEPWRPPATAEPALAVAHLDRVPDPTWRRASYSALTAAAHTGRPGGLAASPTAPTGAGPGGIESEPEGGGVQDEPAEAAPTAVRPGGADVAAAEAPGVDLPSPMSGLPAGTGFGTLVHEVLEYADTAAPDLDAELLARCAAAATARVPGADPGELAAALGVVARTPLGPLAGGRTLADITPRDRLAELEFELPLAGGDGDAHGGSAAATEGASLAGIAALLATFLGDDDAFAAYPAALADLAAADPTARPLRGYLTGSIDAVLRVPGDGGTPRFLVVDYKSNRLGTFDTPLTAHDYRPEATVEAMLHAHYPLQLVLYLVALHRYLAWRLPGYDPDVHLGGGLYLFVRGMCGPATPTGPDGAPYGVVSWTPPRGLVPALSALLDGGDA